MFTYRPESTRRLVEKRPTLHNKITLPLSASSIGANAQSLSPNDVLSEYGLVQSQPSKMARKDSSQLGTRGISSGGGGDGGSGYRVKVEASSSVENQTNVFSAFSTRQYLGNFGNLGVNSAPQPMPPDSGWLLPGPPAAAVSLPQAVNPVLSFSNPITSPFHSPAYPAQSWGQTTYFSLQGPVQQQQQQQQLQQQQQQQQQQLLQPIIFQQPQQQEHLHQQQMTHKHLHHQNQQYNMLPPISQMDTGIRSNSSNSSSNSYQQGDMNLQIPKTLEDWPYHNHNLN